MYRRWLRPFCGFLDRKGVGIGDSCALSVWVGHKFVVFDLWCVIFVVVWGIVVDGEGVGEEGMQTIA